MFMDIHKNTIIIIKIKNQLNIFNINVFCGWIQFFLCSTDF